MVVKDKGIEKKKKKKKCGEIVLPQKSFTAKFLMAKIPEVSFPTAKMFTVNVPDRKIFVFIYSKLF